MTKFDKSNKLMQILINKKLGFSKITPRDKALFNNYFSKEKHCYGNSFNYITQGMYGIGKNNLGYKYQDKENLSAVCFYPRMGKEDEVLFYWIRPVGASIIKKIEKLSKYILDEFHTPIYVKKIFLKQYKELLLSGYTDTSNYPWYKKIYSEDDTFPEIILDCKKIIDNKKRNKQVQNSIKYYKRANEQVNIKKITSLKDRTEAWEVVDKFFKQSITSLEHNISTKYDYYNLIFNCKMRGYSMYLIKKGTQNLGLFDILKINDDYYTSYCALMLRDKVANLNDFSVIYSCKKILDTGGKFLNLGGSETEGLNNFKLKFTFLKKYPMFWAVKY